MKQNSEFYALIVEDEPIILNNIIRKVEKAPANIHVIGEAQSGIEALELLHQLHVDILITDIEMPGMNGLELIRQVREQYPDIRIIILSGYSNFEYARTALRYGVEDYLLKPIDQDTLSTLLDEIYFHLDKERKINAQKTLSIALNNTIESEIPHIFTKSKFVLFYITIGNLPHLASDFTLFSDKQISSLWEKIDFNECYQSNSDIQDLWLIREHSPIQKFRVCEIFSVK